MQNENSLAPLHVFRFQVDFTEVPIVPGGDQTSTARILCSGAFSECTGLEATMEPFIIREGGHNYGAVQRAGQVTFATVILKRGMTRTRHLWNWFEAVAKGGYAYRMDVTVRMLDIEGNPAVIWKLNRAIPIKFKAADLNAISTGIGIEELHLAHEGLSLVTEQ